MLQRRSSSPWLPSQLTQQEFECKKPLSCPPVVHTHTPKSQASQVTKEMYIYEVTEISHPQNEHNQLCNLCSGLILNDVSAVCIIFIHYFKSALLSGKYSTTITTVSVSHNNPPVIIDYIKALHVLFIQRKSGSVPHQRRKPIV